MRIGLIVLVLVTGWHSAAAEVRGVVVDDATGAPIVGAQVRTQGATGTMTTDASGAFECRAVVPEPLPIPHDGPVGRLLAALGRHPWRPAHLHFMVSAPGYQRLVTHVFRRGSQYLDSDAVFGVRSSLVADWVRHEPGRTPDGQTSAVPFTTLDFAFVLNNDITGDRP